MGKIKKPGQSEQCRCCLKEFGLKELWTEYFNGDQREVYGEMVNDCFALPWEPQPGKSEHICDGCVDRLRDAVSFKKEILCSDQLLNQHVRNDSKHNVKQEEESDSEIETEYLNLEFMDDEDKDKSLLEIKIEQESKLDATVKEEDSPPSKRSKRYNEEDLKKCIEAVRSGKMSQTKAAYTFHVPRKTISAAIANFARRKSLVWKHFAIINKDKARCGYCLKTLSFTGGSTGNLSRHIKKMHGAVAIEEPLTRVNQHIETAVQKIRSKSSKSKAGHYIVPLEEAGLPSATSTTQGQTTQAHLRIEHFAKLPASKTSQLDEQIVKFIVKGFHSVSIVEEPEFRNMCEMILPAYSLPGRKTISSCLIPELYESTKDRVWQRIAEADSICLTTDSWTSLDNVSSIAVTAHFIDQDTAQTSILLGSAQFDGRPTPQNLSNFLLSEVWKWGISQKITGIITDNTPNIVAAVRSTDWQHFPCFAHTVDLAVQNCLYQIKEHLDKVKAIVQYFKDSPTATSRLQAMQAQLELPPLKLKQSVITRWISTYNMLERLLKIKDAVVSTLAIEQPGLNTLTLNDWTFLEKCVGVLKMFHEVTVEMCAEKYIPISKVMILIKIMKTHVAKCLIETGPDEYLRLLMILREELDGWFHEVENNELVTEASLLDPRFKKHAFFSEESYDQCLGVVKEKLRALSARSETPSEPTAKISEQPTSNMWAEFDKAVEKEIIQNPTPKTEIDKYLDEPLIKRSDDPLKWWQERRFLYPNLYSLMKDRLCAPATSVPCERVFSKTGADINIRRSLLKPSKASQILFLNYNL